MTIFRKLPTTYVPALVLGASLMGGGAAADSVIPDDLIVQGSTCTGFDCVNGESFGVDTLKLKENNLRIFFEDTSISPFPTNDWRLIANDQASGGANFFAIEDATAARQVFRVDAGAPANALYVSSVGNIGVGTSTPGLDVSIRTGDTPAHRLEQDASGGFTAQTWDVAGNEANFFVRDVTNGSLLSLRIRPGAPTSSLDIAASGNVGMGIASPVNNVHVHSPISGPSGTVSMRLTNGDTGPLNTDGSQLGIDNSETAFLWNYENAGMYFGTNNLQRVTIDASGNVGVGTVSPGAQLHTTGTVRLAGVANCSAGIRSSPTGDLSCLPSSRQFKHVTGELAPDTAVANVMALRPQIGAYKETPDEPEHWLIAEEVAKVDPALVGLRDGAPYTVKMHNVVADLIAVIQQQQRRIEALEKAIAK